MLTDGLTGARVFVRPGVTDRRKRINGLSMSVEQQLGLEPFRACSVSVLHSSTTDYQGAVLGCHRILPAARKQWQRTLTSSALSQSSSLSDEAKPASGVQPRKRR